MQKKNFFSFHFRVHITSPSLMARLLKNERNAKEKLFFFSFPSAYNFAISDGKVTKNERNAKEKLLFFSFPSAYNFAISDGKVTKKACNKGAILEDERISA